MKRWQIYTTFITIFCLITCMGWMFITDCGKEDYKESYKQMCEQVTAIKEISNNIKIKDNVIMIDNFDKNEYSYNISSDENSTKVTYAWKSSQDIYYGEVIFDSNYNVIDKSYSVTEEDIQPYEEYLKQMQNENIATIISISATIALAITFFIYSLFEHDKKIKRIKEIQEDNE